MNAMGPLQNVSEWILSHLNSILFTAIAIVLGYLVYKFISWQIRKLESVEEHLAYTLNRLVSWIIVLIILFAVLGHFNITLGTLSGVLAILGGTILGFASINTFGNALAGLIVMLSRPFHVGDRISFKNQLVDVVGIELIYTKMQTLDNSVISVPNQELLTSQIENFGKKRVVRRHVAITAGFEHDDKYVEKCLLEAAANVPDIVRKPAPFVRITDFQNFAIEYTLYVFIAKTQKMREIDGNLRRTVLRTCKQYQIDISTPSLVRSVS